MNRITVESVEVAYVKTKRNPIRWIFCDRNQGCCPAYACALKINPNGPNPDETNLDFIFRVLMPGMAKDYIRGFMAGVDGRNLSYYMHELNGEAKMLFENGYDDGGIVAREFFSHGLQLFG